MKLLDRLRLDLDSPKRPNEEIYTPLQMSRVLRFLRLVLIVIALIGIVGFLSNVAYTAFNAVTGAHRDAHVAAVAAKADRTSREVHELLVRQAEAIDRARFTSCLQANAQSARAIDAAAGSAEKAAGKQAQALIDVADQQAAQQGKPPTDPAVARAYVDSQKAAARSAAHEVYVDAFPMRDCSTAGIKAFLSQPPSPTNTIPCDPDGKGYCR